MKRFWVFGLALVMGSGALVLLPASASAIPAFARRYGMACSSCHVAWPVLNEFGEDFRMSGYRRYAGQALYHFPLTTTHIRRTLWTIV
jgi:hypothetical protein